MNKLDIAWRVLFAVALVDLTLGVGILVIEPSSVLLAEELGMKGFAGVTPGELQTLSPNLFTWITFVFKSWSAFIIGSSVLTMGIAARAFREGERWGLVHSCLCSRADLFDLPFD